MSIRHLEPLVVTKIVSNGMCYLVADTIHCYGNIQDIEMIHPSEGFQIMVNGKQYNSDGFTLKRGFLSKTCHIIQGEEVVLKIKLVSTVYASHSVYSPYLGFNIITDLFLKDLISSSLFMAFWNFFTAVRMGKETDYQQVINDLVGFRDDQCYISLCDAERSIYGREAFNYAKQSGFLSLLKNDQDSQLIHVLFRAMTKFRLNPKITQSLLQMANPNCNSINCKDLAHEVSVLSILDISSELIPLYQSYC